MNLFLIGMDSHAKFHKLIATISKVRYERIIINSRGYMREIENNGTVNITAIAVPRLDMIQKLYPDNDGDCHRPDGSYDELVLSGSISGLFGFIASVMSGLYITTVKMQSTKEFDKSSNFVAFKLCTVLSYGVATSTSAFLVMQGILASQDKSYFQLVCDSGEADKEHAYHVIRESAKDLRIDAQQEIIETLLQSCASDSTTEAEANTTETTTVVADTTVTDGYTAHLHTGFILEHLY